MPSLLSQQHLAPKCFFCFHPTPVSHRERGPIADESTSPFPPVLVSAAIHTASMEGPRAASRSAKRYLRTIAFFKILIITGH